MASKRDVERELDVSQVKIEMLEKQLAAAQDDKEVLNAQILKLQDAVLSVRTPDAYQDMKFKELESEREPISAEKRERNRIYKEVTEMYLNECENPLFKSAEDLDDMITAGLIRDAPELQSTHGNDES